MCIHCATPVESLYMRYGKDHIVLTPCISTSCNSDRSGLPVLADEYLEHHMTVVVLDLILAKPKAYRHLLYNRASILAPPRPELRPASGSGLVELVKRGLALALVDAYIRWFYLCVQPPQQQQGAEGRWTRLAGYLPIHAGVFFPSLFTPTTGPARAIEAVCNPSPFWIHLHPATDDPILPTLVSYTNVLLVTLIEALALHATVSLITHLAIPQIQHTKPKRSTDPWLASKALLLSQLSPLILLTLVLLWSTKFPHAHATVTTNDRSALIWLIRTFLASLNAGVAIATVLPANKPAWPPLILTAGWTAQTLTSYALYTALS